MFNFLSCFATFSVNKYPFVTIDAEYDANLSLFFCSSFVIYVIVYMSKSGSPPYQYIDNGVFEVVCSKINLIVLSAIFLVIVL